MADHKEPINDEEAIFQANEKWLEEMIGTLSKRLHPFLKEKVHDKLDSLGYPHQQFDDQHIDKAMRTPWYDLWRKYSRDNFPYEQPDVVELENRFRKWDGLEKALTAYLYPVCTDIILSTYRDTLSEWVDNVEKGKALFVDLNVISLHPSTPKKQKHLYQP